MPAAERQAFVQAQCAGDRELLTEVESLLAHDAGSANTSRTVIVQQGAVFPITSEPLEGMPKVLMRHRGFQSPYQDCLNVALPVLETLPR